MKKAPSQEDKLNIPMVDSIWETCKKCTNAYVEGHSKTFGYRIDVRIPQEMPIKTISAFTKRYAETERNAGYDFEYIAVREISHNGQIHYHLACFVDGNKTEKTYEHFQNAEKVLQRVIGPEHDVTGLIDHCDHGHMNGILIRRNDSNQKNLQDVYRQISYLAKEAQKENVKGKRVFSSRFKKK